ncbi:hypothetical protein PMZ80_010546 [Knufia obscura]|uniref:Phytase-like domain-containing protein n=2 Tax=Knufia TaxID=430999 RepID=A0AAN8EMJ3_9EURO|nr:hypothetical protein PMZ80_010546 [Knufia obscura]KAK5950101.1 hypothetical protein OHC33_008816 [Knufia fluminis]
MYSIITSALLASTALALPQRRQAPVNTTTCNGKTYEYLSLAGYGFTPSNSRDKFGDTAGGIGSSAALDAKTWTLHDNGTYTGLLYALPDRGWNTEGTLNFQPRVHKFQIEFDPASTGPSPNLQLHYLDSIRFSTDADVPFTGLDPNILPPYLTTTDGTTLPSATYSGDGFGGDGPGGSRPSLDSEGIVLMPDGTMYISDEYGDYIYHFTAEGRLITAIPPPEAFVPIRNDSVSFSAASPPRYDPDRETVPEDPDFGRANNQGLEALTRSPDGKYLYALTQSALSQDGGAEGDEFRRWSRLVRMDLDAAEGGVPPVVAQYVVELPVYTDEDDELAVAAQSEIKYISDTQFLVLARDGAGRGQDETESRYRRADVFDISGATDVNEMDTVAPGGSLAEGIVQATYCTFLDFNVNSELTKFGLHNGGEQDVGLLNEKWESLVLAPVQPVVDGQQWGNWGGKQGSSDEYFLFSLSDNDFITQDGYMKGGEFQYSDESGYDLLNQVLVFKVRLPQGSQPLVE